jgi:hypothetical protein
LIFPLGSGFPIQGFMICRPASEGASISTDTLQLASSKTSKRMYKTQFSKVRGKLGADMTSNTPWRSAVRELF